MISVYILSYLQTSGQWITLAYLFSLLRLDISYDECQYLYIEIKTYQ